MPIPSDPGTDELLSRSYAGDKTARGQLLQRHRDRLRRMVALRIDPRLAARIDPSDVVQEALAEANVKLDKYMHERPLAFYPWLRQITWEKLVHLHRRHVRAGRRSVGREKRQTIPHDSAAELAAPLFDPSATPSRIAIRAEIRERVHTLLNALPEVDREVLVLRNLEQLSVAETAAVLQLTPGAVKMRHVRALARLRAALDSFVEGLP